MTVFVKIKEVRRIPGSRIYPKNIGEYPHVTCMTGPHTVNGPLPESLYLTMIRGSCYYISHYTEPDNAFFFYRGVTASVGDHLVFDRNILALEASRPGLTIEYVLAHWENYLIEDLL